MTSKSVVQDWLAEKCSLMQQTVLLSALRGCDGIPKEDPSKSLTRVFRGTILHDAAPSLVEGNTFMWRDPQLVHKRMAFLGAIDHYPVHWVFHFAHACEIVGFKHPVEDIGLFWRRLYYDICAALHVRPETEAQVDERLKDGTEILR